MTHKKKPANPQCQVEPPGTQTVLTVPGRTCDNCHQPLPARAYEHRPTRSTVQVVCRGCLQFLATIK